MARVWRRGVQEMSKYSSERKKMNVNNNLSKTFISKWSQSITIVFIIERVSCGYLTLLNLNHELKITTFLRRLRRPIQVQFRWLARFGPFANPATHRHRAELSHFKSQAGPEPVADPEMFFGGGGNVFSYTSFAVFSYM